MNFYTTLITPGELRALTVPAVLIDASFDLGDTGAGERAYSAAHLPGAHYLHLDRDLSGAKTGTNGRHPLPARVAFARLVGTLRITPATQVVAYDRGDGAYAARAWWLLRWLGHTAVAVLDGGLAAWGAPLSSETAARDASAAPYPASPTPAMPTVDAATLLQALGARRIVDARAAERFRGDVEPLDPRAGHIPGAFNRCFKDNLQAGRFKSAAALRAEFEALLGPTPPEDVVHQCGSGVTAAHNLLAMAHAGLGIGVLYPGSWSEWCSDAARPIALG